MGCWLGISSSCIQKGIFSVRNECSAASLSLGWRSTEWSTNIRGMFEITLLIPKLTLMPLRRLKARNVFEPCTTTLSKLLSYLTCFHFAKFTSLSFFSLVETISSLQIWERPMSCHAKCSLPVAICSLETLLA